MRLPWTKQTGERELYVVAGLGNPGKQYEDTRHNVGFMVVDELAERHRIPVKKIKHKALVGEGTIAGKRVMLVKPMTYMNLSGESIGEVLRFYKVPLERYFVIFDDISLPVGATRIREKGSAGGHNGMKNIIQHLGTEAFVRVRVGVGEKPNGWDLADYVTGRFLKEEGPLIEMGIERAALAAELILEKGIQEAMNRTNGKA